MKVKLSHSFEEIISLENLFSAWKEFIVGKKSKPDVLSFSMNLADNIISLHENLVNRTYRHGGYESFFVNDPKRRHIHKASVRDRLLHHAIYRVLYPFFDRLFIADSYSCRIVKGTHKAIKRFNQMAHSESRNNHRTCWVLKCDIRKFFASIDHGILMGILGEYISDKNIIWLLGEVIGSFETYQHACHPEHSEGSLVAKTSRDSSAASLPQNDSRKIGLPLGNLTSQLFANVYLNELDQWVKHNLREKNFIRYADDFVILSADRKWLEIIRSRIGSFLYERLKLYLHPNKIYIKTYASGVDFLGWINYPTHRVLRRATRRRMLARMIDGPGCESLQSYLGMLKFGNARKLAGHVRQFYWLSLAS